MELLIGVVLTILVMLIVVLVFKFVFRRLVTLLILFVVSVGIFHIFVMPITDMWNYGKMAKTALMSGDSVKVDPLKRTLLMKNSDYSLLLDSSKGMDRLDVSGKVKLSDRESVSDFLRVVDKGLSKVDDYKGKQTKLDGTSLSGLFSGSYENVLAEMKRTKKVMKSGNITARVKGDILYIERRE